jgi:hypothetical protein
VVGRLVSASRWEQAAASRKITDREWSLAEPTAGQAPVVASAGSHLKAAGKGDAPGQLARGSGSRASLAGARYVRELFNNQHDVTPLRVRSHRIQFRCSLDGVHRRIVVHFQGDNMSWCCPKICGAVSTGTLLE